MNRPINLRDLLENRFDAVDCFLQQNLKQLREMEPHLERSTTYIGERPRQTDEKENTHAANLIGDLIGQETEAEVDYHDPQFQSRIICNHIEFLLSGSATYFQRLWFTIGLLYSSSNSFEIYVKQATEAGVYEEYVKDFHTFIDHSLMGTFSDADSRNPQILNASKHPFEICLLCLQRFSDTLENPATSY